MPEVILTNIEMYKNIVDSHYNEYLKLSALCDDISKNDDCSREETEEKIYRVQCAMDCEAAIVIIFSYMTIETFCNTFLVLHMARKYVSSFPFLTKLNKTIKALFSENGKSISNKNVHEQYGADMQKLIDMRNAMVHRFPVRVGLSIKTDEGLEKASHEAVGQIERAYFRRVDKLDVERAAAAYKDFLAKLTSAGIDLKKLDFLF